MVATVGTESQELRSIESFQEAWAMEFRNEFSNLPIPLHPSPATHWLFGSATIKLLRSSQRKKEKKE